MARDASRAAIILVFILNVCFFQCIWGTKTLLESARDAPSILPTGAWAGPSGQLPTFKVLDPGAPAWQTEPWFAMIRSDYIRKHTLPVWNPSQAFGAPLAANMQSQPFSPFTLLLLPRLTPATYNFYLLFRLFVAGFSTYLFLRFFVSFVSALGAGVASMLGGYFILFLSMPHLSVEVLLPACLGAAEYLIRTRSYKAVVVFSLVVAASILGGMPESSLLALSFTAAYAFFRVVVDNALRTTWRASLLCLILGFVLAAGLSVFLLLPFGEYLKLSHNSHEALDMGGRVTGLMYERFSTVFLCYFFPLLFGPINSHTLGGIEVQPPGYFGAALFFFSLLSFLALFGPGRRADRRLNQLTVFFLCAAAAIVCKRYGLEPVQSIGRLPFFSLVNFPKYEEALLAICVSVLCGIGIHRLCQRHLSSLTSGLALAGTAGLILATVISLHHLLWRELHTSSKGLEKMPAVALIVPCIAIALIGGFLTWSSRSFASPQKLRLSAYGLVAALAFELSANYIFPVYLIFNRVPRKASSPYAGAPFVTALQNYTSKDHSRIFGRDELLVPNWASAFDLTDIRALDALFYGKYFPFLRNFFVNHDALAPDLESCFRGFGPYEFSDPSERRLLQLSSVKYLCTSRPYYTADSVIDDVWKQNEGHLRSGHEMQISRRDVSIDHVIRSALWEHPPYRRLPYRVTLGAGGSPIFSFSYALDPAVFNKTVGDGVGFTLEAKDANGRISALFSQYIDPKHNEQQRHWMNASVDLEHYRGQSIELLFSTDPGPRNDTNYDWAVWSDFHFGSGGKPVEHEFEPVYDDEAKIYRYEHVLPRAAVFSKVDLVRGDAEVLARLRDPSFDVFSRVVVDSSKLTSDQLRGISELNQRTTFPVEPSTIMAYEPRAVTIATNLDRNGLLMLNDSDYPGWVVDIDGSRGSWFTADYMFRGLLVPAGRHVVRFTYQPASFTEGVTLSLLTLAGMLLIPAVRVLVRRKGIPVSQEG